MVLSYVAMSYLEYISLNIINQPIIILILQPISSIKNDKYSLALEFILLY